MVIKSSVSLRDDQHAFAKALVVAGRFPSVSAVLQQGLDLLQQQDADALVLRDIRVGAAEAGRKLFAEFGPLGHAHDGGRHAAGPAEVVAVERVQQRVDVRGGAEHFEPTIKFVDNVIYDITNDIFHLDYLMAAVTATSLPVPDVDENGVQ